MAAPDRAEQRRLVREGWDRASWRYRAEGRDWDAFAHDREEHRAWLRPMLDALTPGARVLDLGCGCGVPDDELLAERFEVTGVDFSPVQLGRARAAVPTARFLEADLATVDFPDRSFDGVVCLYAIIHLPLADQPPLLNRVRRWLTAGGWFVLMAGHSSYEGTEDDWLGSGAPMFWSHADAATYRRWLLEAGFRVVSQELVPEGGASHELFRAVVPTNAGLGT